MKEIKDILSAFEEANRLGKKTALATVVHVQGSSYRRPGARMLVTEDGRITGAISGGCLEGDALRKAVLAITQEKNKLVIYDTTDEDDAKLGVQLGCNGIVSILFEPLPEMETQQHPISVLREKLAFRRQGIIVSGYSLNNAVHFGTVAVENLSDLLRMELEPLLTRVLADRKSQHIEISVEDNQQRFFIEYYEPPVSLLIVGAGNDAIPLADMADLLGWTVTVIDGRATHATQQRFGKANLGVGKPKELINQLELDERTAVVLMTHNYNYDIAMLEELVSTSVSYIGLLGPAAKRDRMLDELEQKGIVVGEAVLQKIYGPTGLDLGAEVSAEIALSVTAEIMAVMLQKEPVHLREKPLPIHYRTV